MKKHLSNLQCTLQNNWRVSIRFPTPQQTWWLQWRRRQKWSEISLTNKRTILACRLIGTSSIRIAMGVPRRHTRRSQPPNCSILRSRCPMLITAFSLIWRKWAKRSASYNRGKWTLSHHQIQAGMAHCSIIIFLMAQPPCLIIRKKFDRTKAHSKTMSRLSLTDSCRKFTRSWQQCPQDSSSATRGSRLLSRLQSSRWKSLPWWHPSREMWPAAT